MSKRRRVAAHQVNFLPWAGFWHKLVSADVFVVCAGFKFTRRGYENRVRMEDTGAWATIPVSSKRSLCCDAIISDTRAVGQIARRIDHWSRQRRYKYRNRISPVVECLRDNGEAKLYQLNLQLIRVILDILGHRGTEVRVDKVDRTDWIVEDIISDIIAGHGNVYLSGASGPAYADGDKIKGIEELYVQDLCDSTPGSTVLHMIAECDDPLTTIHQLGGWRKW